jgi:hypothetical protein
MIYKKLDVLGQLLGSYFHQDWTDEFDSDSSALQSIIESEPKARLAAGGGEIDALLAASLPEVDLAGILIDQVGCYFDPSSEGLTCEQWLRRVRKKFDAVLQER